MKIAIVGAGIGGLTTGILLSRKGIDVHLFEQANEIKAVGAGIVLAHNAMQIYKECGLYDEILARGNPVTSLNITNKNLEYLSKIDTKRFDKQYLVSNIAIHRADLLDILVKCFNDRNRLHLGKKLVEIDDDSNYKLKFSDGETQSFDALIASDGINSVVRNTCFKKSFIRDTNQKCWRGVVKTNLPSIYRNELFEAWGLGDRFGFVQLSSDYVYWYALHNVSKKYKDKNIDDIFSNYHPVISELITKTKESDIFESNICDLKPIDNWVERQICLLGDAAHATTPNLGQGACQAIEDAYALSYCIEKYPLKKALLSYEKKRKEKAKLVVDLSWKFGKVSQIQNPIAAAVRNRLIQLLPNEINASQFRKIYTLNIAE